MRRGDFFLASRAEFLRVALLPVSNAPTNQPTNQMKIKITLDNNTAINRELDKINGRATSFTITCTKELLEIVAEAEKKLSILPKAERKGAKLSYRPAGPSANSYKYAAKSTRVTCERGTTGWFLTGVIEAEVQPKSPAHMSIGITPTQAAEIQRRAVEPFTVLA